MVDGGRGDALVLGNAAEGSQQCRCVVAAATATAVAAAAAAAGRRRAALRLNSCLL